MIEIRLLGPFGIRRDGAAVALPARKSLALLALLALRPGAPCPRERLCDLLWPRSTAAQGRASLRQAFAHLRRALGDGGNGLFESRNDCVALLPDRFRVDAAELAAMADADDIETLERAASLYAGDLLEDLALDEPTFDEWRRAEGQRLRAAALKALQRLLEHYAGAGQAEPALRIGERLLALEPSSEEAHRALIRLHIDRGALGSAMRQYERCRNALAAELGIRPSAETEALQRLIRSRPSPDHPADAQSGSPLVAVLPFANLSDDPAQAYFARGFAEDVSRELARFRSLRVVSAHSSFAAAALLGDAHAAVARLGARYALSGSVRRTLASVRVAVELTDSQTGHHLWAHRYDLAPEAVLDGQDEIARSVAGALAVQIDAERLRAARRRPVHNLDAYDAWLRGVACLRRGTLDSHAEARTLFERALELDADFARAYSGLSLAHFNEWSCHAWERWDETQRAAYEYAMRGVAIDDGDHVTHFILGRILLYRREYARSRKHLERAEAINPNDADMLAQLAVSSAYLGEPDRGVEHARTAMRLNPFHDDWYFGYAALPSLVARRPAAAFDLASKVPDLSTDMPAYLAAASLHLGRTGAARENAARFVAAFRRHVMSGRDHADDEPVRWLLHVNPFVREEDASYLLEGLQGAGLQLPA